MGMLGRARVFANEGFNKFKGILVSNGLKTAKKADRLAAEMYRRAGSASGIHAAQYAKTGQVYGRVGNWAAKHPLATGAINYGTYGALGAGVWGLGFRGMSPLGIPRLPSRKNRSRPYKALT